MAEPTFAREKKQPEKAQTLPPKTSLEVVPQRKEVEELRTQLKALDRQFDYLKQKLDTARATNGQAVRMESLLL
jgi:hypothetical protein